MFVKQASRILSSFTVLIILNRWCNRCRWL